MGILTLLLTLAVLFSHLPSNVAVYGNDYSGDDGNSDQDVKQKQKCKIGVFGDPKDSVSSTVPGSCDQHAYNSID